MPTSYGPMLEEDEDATFDLLASAFATKKEDVPAWIERASKAQVRVLREGAAPVASLILVPMAHVFGGREVETVGIAGVGVALHKRGTHAALELMTRAVREIADAGVAVSSLFPATQTLYRRVGYERAGKLMEATIYREALANVPRAALEARPLGPEDQPEMEAMLRASNQRYHGSLVRGPYLWNRLWMRPQKPARVFGFYEQGALRAYLAMLQEPDAEHPPEHTVRLVDVAYASREGALAILGFLRAQRSLCTAFTFRGPPSDGLLGLLEEPRYDEVSVLDWMLRLTNLRAAFAQRGYPQHAKVELTFEVDDVVLAGQSGAHRLVVEGGAGALESAKQGAWRLSVRTLASIYSGYLRPAEARRMGLLEGDGDLGAWEAAFHDAVPAVSEMF